MKERGGPATPTMTADLALPAAPCGLCRSHSRLPGREVQTLGLSPLAAERQTRASPLRLTGPGAPTLGRCGSAEMSRALFTRGLSWARAQRHGSRRQSIQTEYRRAPSTQASTRETRTAYFVSQYARIGRVSRIYTGKKAMRLLEESCGLRKRKSSGLGAGTRRRPEPCLG